MTENFNSTKVLLAKAHLPAKATLIYADKVHRKPLFLHATPTDAREARRQERKSRQRKNSGRILKPLTACEKRALTIHKIPKSATKGVGAGQAQIGLRLASADYHGALFEVVRSRCPSRVGVRGICVKETKGMFYLITERDRLKEIPKEHTVFRFELPTEESTSGNIKNGISKLRSMVFELHGSQFMYRAAERAGRKFKQKPATDL